MTDTTEGLLDLAVATDPLTAGRKAASLASAIGDGEAVPDGVVIPASLAARLNHHPNEFSRLLTGLAERLGGRVAVRSSAADEDTAEASFAGQYDSVLNVTSDEELGLAVLRCVRSAQSPAVSAYRRDIAPAGASIAVLVQRMLRPTAAGVAFSVDPVTGDDHVVIEAMSGVAEALLAGEVTGERWTVSAGAVPESATGAALDSNSAAGIAAMCRRLADRAGHPVDIEWAIDGGEIWLLQSRPITALPLAPVQQLPDHQTFVRDPRVAEPLHPLSFTSCFPVHSRVLADVFEEFGLPLAGLDHRHHLGRVFTRAVPLIDRGKDGDDPPLVVLKMLMRVVPAMRRRARGALAWRGDAPIDALIGAWERTGRERVAKRTARLRGVEITRLSDNEIADHVDAVQEHLFEVAREHFRLVLGAVSLPMGRLGMFVEERLGWDTADIFTLVQGYGHASVAHDRALGEVIDELGATGVTAAITDPASLAGHPALEAYLEKFGHVVHLDLSQPTEAEDPRLVADHVRRHTARSEGASTGHPPISSAHDAEARALAGLRSAADRARFSALLATARRGRPFGDETETDVLSALGLMRMVGVELGSRWAAASRLDSPDDVWFLELDEMRTMLQSSAQPAPDIVRRRREFNWAQAHSPPDHVGPDPTPMPPPSLVAKKHRSTLGAAFWALAAMEGEQPPLSADGVGGDEAASNRVLRGQPGSPGRTVGTARLVRSAAEFGRVEPGDVIVCPVTTASWSPIFGVIAGLITERGGPLSHPATLAREYGVPAVLSAAGATHRIQDGARVRIDGARGVIEIVEP